MRLPAATSKRTDELVRIKKGAKFARAYCSLTNGRQRKGVREIRNSPVGPS